MPRIVYPGLSKMARTLAKELKKDPQVVRRTILNNAKHILSGIPPEELLSIFEEGNDGTGRS